MPDMSQKEKAALCGYARKPVICTCSNCAHVVFTRVLPKRYAEYNKRNNVETYTLKDDGVDKNITCTKHDFPTIKSATCNDWV